MTSRKLVLSIGVLLLTLPPLALAQGTYTQIDYPGGDYTYCGGINANGDIVGSYGQGDREYGFLLSGGVYSSIAYPQAKKTTLTGVNDNGQIVGDTSMLNGFVYDTKTQTFTKISYPGGYLTAPLAINNAGAAVGFVQFLYNPYVGFEVSRQGNKTISVPGADATYATGISSLGVVVGYYSKGANLLNFTFANGKYQQLTIPDAAYAQVNGINPAGTALVGIYVTANAAAGFLYENRALQTLQFPGGRDTNAIGINASGVVSGTFYYDTGGPHGFTWTPPADGAKK